MSPLSSRLILVVLLALLVADRAVLAESSKQEQALQLLREGNALFEQGQYEAALVRYHHARRLHSSPRLDYNIASAYDELGKHAQAANFYARFLRGAGPASAAEMLGPARQRLTALRAKLGMLKIDVAVADVVVKVDGETIGRTPLLDDPLYLEPGPHFVVCAHPHHPRFEQTIYVTQGRPVTVPLAWTQPTAPRPTPPSPLLNVAPPVAKPVPQVAQPAPSAATPNQPAAAVRRSKTLWGYTALGVGAALLASAGALWAIGGVQGRQAYDDYEGQMRSYNLGGSGDRLPSYSDVQGAKTKLIVADVLGGVAAGALVFAIYELVTRPEAPRLSSSPALRVLSREGGLSFAASF